jgi:hypothetical protein
VAYFSSIALLILAATQPPGAAQDTTYFDAVVFLTMFLLIGEYSPCVVYLARYNINHQAVISTHIVKRGPPTQSLRSARSALPKHFY